MADILIQPAVPSLFTHTESASSLIVDSPTADSNNNTTSHHHRTSPNSNHQNNSHQNSNNSSGATNKYIGHVSRLRSVFTQYALTLNDLKPGEHRSRYSHHHDHRSLASPTRGIADGADEISLSPPLPTLPLVTTSSSTIIERSRSLSNPRILDHTTSQISSMRNGMSSLTMSENLTQIPPTSTTVTTNEDHTIRFRKAKEMFQTLEEEATRTIPITNIMTIPTTTTTSKSIRQSDHFNNETYRPDLMHDGQKITVSKVNTEHIPDLIIDHRQQQQMENPSKDGNCIRDIPVQFLGTSSLSSPTHSGRPFTSIPIHRTTPPSTSPLISDEEVPYAMINRKHISTDQHYDFPADAVEQLKKHQREENDPNNNNHNNSSSSSNHVKPSNEEIADRIVASILPSNILKRMDHLNTKFIKPTTIDCSLPKFSFQEHTTEHSPKQNNNNNNHHHHAKEAVVVVDEEEETTTEEEVQKWIDNPMLNNMKENLIDQVHEESTSSSPIFYEKPGLPDMKDDDDNDNLLLSPNGTRRVKFSSAPIRVGGQ